MKKMKAFIRRIPWIGVLMFLSPVIVLAQGFGKIEGKVMDGESKEPLVGVNVVIKGTTMGAATGTDGSYVITDIPAGEHRLIASMMGYRKITKKVKVFADEITTAYFELKEEAFKLKEVMVTGTRTEHTLGDVPVIASVVTKEEIKAANIETIAEALRWVPGIYQLGTGVKCQGMGMFQIPVLIDGQRIYKCPGRCPETHRFPVEQIERIEMMKGGASLLYGSDAVGGVINVITKDAPNKTTGFSSASVGSYGSRIYRLSHGHKPGKFGYRISYTYNGRDGYEPVTDKSSEASYSGVLEYTPTSSCKFAMKPTIQTYEYLSKGETKRKDRYLANGSFNMKVNEVSNIAVRGSFMQIETRGKHWWMRTNQAYLTYSRQIFGLNLLTLGYQLLDDHFYEWRVDRNRAQGLFLEDEINLGSFSLLLGARMDYLDHHKDHVSHLASMLYNVTKDLRLRVQTGRSFQTMRGCQILPPGLSQSRGKWYRNTGDLATENTDNYQLAVEYGIPSNFLGRISVFRNNSKDLVRDEMTDEKVEGKPVWIKKNIAEAYTQGADLGLSSRFMENVFLSLGYSFLDTESKETGKEFSLSPKHIAKLGADLKWEVFKVNLKGEYIGERYRDGANTELLDGYFLAYLKVSKNIKDYQVFLAVDNVYGTEFEEATWGVDKSTLGRQFKCGISASF